MDPPIYGTGAGHDSKHRGKSAKKKQHGHPSSQPSGPQLFDDTSATPYPPNYGQYGQSAYAAPTAPAYQPMAPPIYNPNAPPGMPGQAFFNDPMKRMAFDYSSKMIDEGKQYVASNVERWLSIPALRYYFAVDTSYVSKKLLVLLCPFAHTDWSVKYNQESPIPVAPRYDVNAPDLYIPVMAYVTYILLAGYLLGTQSRFSPELLGIQASTALVWSIIELAVVLITLYVMNIGASLKTFDIIAYCGYKYFGMIVILICNAFFMRLGYMISLVYMGAASAFFIARSLRVAVLPSTSVEHHTGGGKRRFYLLLSMAAMQPALMYWLTYHLIKT